MIIARAECDYRAPAHFGDELEIGVQVGDVGRSSFSLLYGIVQFGSGRLVASGKTVMVSYDYEAATSVPLPTATRDLLHGVKGSDPGLPRV